MLVKRLRNRSIRVERSKGYAFAACRRTGYRTRSGARSIQRVLLLPLNRTPTILLPRSETCTECEGESTVFSNHERYSGPAMIAIIATCRHVVDFIVRECAVQLSSFPRVPCSDRQTGEFFRI